MYRLSQIILVLLLSTGFVLSQNPHGNNLRMDCAKCHTSDSWDVDYRNINFDHATTNFALEGRHAKTDCAECHQSLIFSKVNTECVECHTDIHKNTLTSDCKKCHNSDDWIIDDMTDIHEEAGFILTGAHIFLDCEECHVKSSELIFNYIDNDCYSCHEQDYNEASAPDHIKENFSFDCYSCHDLEAMNWVISHDFFPLEKGHNINECAVCHKENNYTTISTDCVSCHNDDYDNTTNPDHQLNMFSKNCNECHSLDPGWAPAEYKDHDSNDFPIYSGEHEGKWTNCIDCHIDPGNYSVFSCIDCHEHNKSKMDDEHDDENGYIYDSNACYKCHPNGKE